MCPDGTVLEDCPATAYDERAHAAEEFVGDDFDPDATGTGTTDGPSDQRSTL